MRYHGDPKREREADQNNTSGHDAGLKRLQIHFHLPLEHGALDQVR
jgi:hypothetical protein